MNSKQLWLHGDLLYKPCNHKMLSFLNPLVDVITVCQMDWSRESQQKTAISVQINLLAHSVLIWI